MKFGATRHTVYAFENEWKLIEMCAPIECEREINFRCWKPSGKHLLGIAIQQTAMLPRNQNQKDFCEIRVRDEMPYYSMGDGQ